MVDNCTWENARTYFRLVLNTELNELHYELYARKLARTICGVMVLESNMIGASM